MTFANPLALWLLGALPLVVLLHLYRVSRPTVPVTTLHLWEPVDPEQGSARAAWRRVRLSWLLALQLLATAAVALALAQPEIVRDARGWPRIALVVDTSASMRATDESGGRFAAAVDRARTMIASLEPGQEAMLVTTRPEVLLPFTGDAAALRQALDGLAPDDREGRPGAAVRLAHELAAGGPPAQIRLLTDGAFGPLAELPEGLGGQLDWHVVGNRADNLGITALTLRAVPGSTTGHQLYLVLANFSSGAREVTLAIDLDGTVVQRQAMTIAAGVERALVFPFEHRDAGLLTARIDGDDDLAADDTARLVLPAPRQREVLLVSDGNLFLAEALRALPGTGLTLMTPGEYRAAPPAADVVVLDGAEPAELQPGRYLLIRSVPGGAPLERIGEIALPPITSWDHEHPVTRHLDLAHVAIRDAVAVRPTGSGTVLARSGDAPLIHAWDDGAVRAVFLGFDVFSSDLRVRAAFPMFVHDALAWLDPMDLEGRTHLATGEPIAIEPSGEVTVSRPGESGQTIAVPDGGIAYAGTDRVGVYRVSGAAGERLHAVNLLSAVESNTAPGRAPRDEAGEGPPPTYPAATALWRALALVALLALAVEAVLYARRRRVRSIGSLVVRASGIAVLAGALVLPALWVPTDAMHVAFLLDHSRSVPETARGDLAARVAEAVARAGEEDTVRTLAFGAEAAPAGQSAAVDGSATDIALALRHAASTMPAGGNRRVVLVSDGLETGPGAIEAARDLARRGVAVYPVVMGGPAPGEVMLTGMTLPRAVREGEPVDLRLHAWSGSGAEATVTLARDGQTIAAETVTLRPGSNAFDYEDARDDAGYAVYEASIESADDGLAENNRAMGAVAVRAPLSALVLDREPERAAPLVDALGAQRIDVTLAGPDGVADALGQIERFDVVILSNLSSLEMTRAEMERLRTYVADLGGGLVMLGGEDSFGVGGYFQTPIEEALPVTMEARQKLDVPTTAVALVIDRSGSMNRNDGEHNRLELAKEAAQRAVALLDERSEIGVLAFDMRSQWVVPIGPIDDRPRVMDAIATLQAGGGGTQLLWGLQKAYRGIAKRETSIRHVIILSDGEVYSSEFPLLLSRMVDRNITVSAVTIGSRHGQPQLRDISRLGKGRFYFSSDATKLPRIFTMETQIATRSGLVEERFRPVAGGTRHEIMQGVAWDAVPALDGYVATTAKKSAETLLLSHEDDPVLAVWRYGLGRAAAFTSELKPRWGARWLEWQDVNRLMAQLVRWTARSRQPGNVHARTGTTGERVEVVVDVAEDDGTPRNFVDGRVALALPDGRREVLKLQQTGPGRYRAETKAVGPGIYLTEVSLGSDAKSAAPLTGSAAQAYAPEYAARGVDRALLESIAAASGGRLLDAPGDVFDIERVTGERPMHIAPLLLLAALVLLLADLGLRWLKDRREGEGETIHGGA